MALTVWEHVTVTGQYAGLVASSWKGQTYLRSAPAKVNNNSPKQQAHKQLYKILYDIFQPAYKDGIKPFFNPSKMTPMNAIIKAQNPSYWKANSESWADFYNTLTKLKFPITDLSFSMNAFYKGIIDDFIYLTFDDATFSGTDIQNIKKYHYIGYDKANKKTFYTNGNFSEMPQRFITALTNSTEYTGFLWFTTETKATGLYKTGIENGVRKYIL